jgi:AcrR family transcriptional regulator
MELSEPGAGRSERSRDRSGRRAPGTPRSELERQRLWREIGVAQVREEILEAVLAACGERGYREVTVKDIYERYGGYRAEFYTHFTSKAECYEAAYAAEIERLCRRLIRTCEAAESWPAGLRAALEELASFVSERREVATGVLVGAHVAGAAVGAKRAEVFERLTRAVDDARRETSASRHAPPPIAASFILSAIEESAVSALTRGEPESFEAAVPSLAWLATNIYFGEEEARAQL